MQSKSAVPLAILALLLTFSASPIVFASESHTTRFRASFTGPFHIIARTTTTVTVGVTGEGRATHLGHSVLSATVNIVLATGVGTSTDTTITNANEDDHGDDNEEGHADKLFLTSVASETPPSPQGIITLSGTYTITGGTGELRGAKGSGTISGTVSLPAGTVSQTFSGTITLPDE